MHLRKVMLVVLLVFVSAVILVSCKLFTAEDRAEVLTQQNCLRGCIDRCPPEMARYGACATNCGQLCKAAGEQQQSR
jgi:hypothetical protein